MTPAPNLGHGFWTNALAKVITSAISQELAASPPAARALRHPVDPWRLLACDLHQIRMIKVKAHDLVFSAHIDEINALSVVGPGIELKGPMGSITPLSSLKIVKHKFAALLEKGGDLCSIGGQTRSSRRGAFFADLPKITQSLLDRGYSSEDCRRRSWAAT